MTETIDTIIENGTVLTVDAAMSEAEAIAVGNGRIVAIGSRSDIAKLAGPNTDRIDMAGGVAIPGMIDNHTHQLLAGLDAEHVGAKVNIAHSKSIEDIKRRIAEEVARVGPGKWIGTSCMWRGGLAENRFPTRKDLDEVAPDNPVYIFQSGKNVIVNSMALRIAQIDAASADPVGPDYSAGHIVKDDQNEPTGHLIAGAGDLARRRWWEALGQPMKKWDFLHFDQPTYEAAIQAQMKIFNACGLTGTRDMGVSTEEMAAYRGLADRGGSTLRTELIVGLPIRYVPISEAEALIENYDGPAQGDGDELTWIGGFKFVLQNDGFWSHSPEKAKRLILAANRKGWTLAIHGPAMVDQDAWDDMMLVLEEANAERPLAGRRFSFEHWIGTKRPQHLRRLKEWGFIVAPNPNLSYFAAGRSFQMHKALQEVRIAKPSALSPLAHAVQEWGLHIRDWVDAGFVVTGGTDCPATTYDADQPLLGMYIARTQASLAGPLLPDQTVTREQALRMFTINGAYSMSSDSWTGSLELGKVADIAVLTGNPLTTSDEGLLEIKVQRTLLGGKTVYERARAPS
jgi:predicted amidohydrolase YtcJ